MNARLADKAATMLFWCGALLIVGFLLWFIGYVLYHGGSSISWDFLTRPPENLRAGGGIGPQLFNSFYLLILSMLLTIPLGVGGGIYMAEYARPSLFTSIVRLSTETLASLPSIVVGMFGLLIFVNYMGWGFSVASGALALTVFNLPVMVRISEESLRNLGPELREASLALGASRWQTITRVLIPSAFPGIVTGIILTAGRCFGEAAALLYTAGISSPPLNFGQWNPAYSASPLNPFRPAASLAVHIWKVNAEGLIPDLRRVADGSAAVLMIVVLVFNIVARWIGSRIYRRLTGV